MSEGMAGMVHANDVRIAEGMRTSSSLPTPRWHDRPGTGRSTTPSSQWHRDPGPTSPTSTSSSPGMNEPMGYCFPHFFVLPMYSSASSYRFRPARAGGDAHGDLVADALPRGQRAGQAPDGRSRGSATTRASRRSPPRTSRTCPASSGACTPRGFEYMRLAEAHRGAHLELHRLIDGFLAGPAHDQLVPALHTSTSTPSTAPSSTSSSDLAGAGVGGGQLVVMDGRPCLTCVVLKKRGGHRVEGARRLVG